MPFRIHNTTRDEVVGELRALADQVTRALHCEIREIPELLQDTADRLHALADRASAREE